MPRPHAIALAQAFLVTFLWSTSWVLIKTGLDEIPALTFAGLRYGLAFLVLLPFLARSATRVSLMLLTRRDWALLAALGVVMVALTQGAQFLALERLSAQATSLVLSFTPAMVAVVGTVALAERFTKRQAWGVALFLLGAYTFLYPVAFPRAELVGIGIALVGLASNAGAAVLGRFVKRGATIPAAVVTAVSMGVGAALLLGGGVTTQGLPTLSARSWAIVAWLAVVNTAFAFTLWNLTLRRLSAVESSVVNNTMLIQIAVLAWLFLDEPLGARQLAGLVLASLGTLVVQCGTRRPAPGDRA